MTPDGLPAFDAVLRLAVAFLLALPLGWDREQRSRSAGLRTYPLLSVCACAFLVVGQELAAGASASAHADVFYGLLSGIGFVGSGALVQAPEQTRGLSTAVSLWVTGAIGAGVAYGAPQISAALALMSLVALRAPSSRARRQVA